MLVTIVLFDRFTALDAVGPYEVLSSLPGAEVVFAAHTPGPVVNEKGTLRLTADAALADVSVHRIAAARLGRPLERPPRHHALAGHGQAFQLALEYDPQPPYQAGSPATAPPAITGALRARRDQILT